MGTDNIFKTKPGKSTGCTSDEKITKVFVTFGNWIFRCRNIIFPLFYAVLFIPSQQIFKNNVIALILGGIFIAAGITIRGITIGPEYIIRGGRSRKIHAENLVTGEIYSLCRKPVYIGDILLILGFGIFASSRLFIMLFFPVSLIIYFRISRAEEAFLIEKSGHGYLDYKSGIMALLDMLT
jgi:protein-S-isoprenylcysteine O-methyltransferase Ste14